ncbi:G-protein coupled receptor Mth2-like [Parasteatoda tepidariorum]|uniref:G-protein coupled receptor Mth2-like n=1 Tax=Parasteatoda tepidariorum TaxID=114398 RepID=UPI001C71AE26|nr:G-protein coupled receptor Mth2-like [Parasteatoda tepidariorum]
MTSSVVLFSLVVMFLGIVTSFTNETDTKDGIVEKNNSEFFTAAGEAVLEENSAEKNNLEFPTLLSDSVLKENPAEKNKSEFPTLENGAVLAENLVEKDDSENHTIPVFVENLDENNSSEPSMYDDEYSGKDELFLSCDKWDYDPTEFVILPNGSAFVSSKNLTYEEPFYNVINNFLVVCIPENNGDTSDETKPVRYLSLTGIVISMVCLSMHLIVFSLVPDLQNLPGCNLACLCASLLLSYMFMLIGQDREEDGYPIICMIAGVLTYFFFLASFLWMSVIAFDVCRSIVLAARKMKITRHEFRVKKFLWYSLFTWCTALVFTVTAVVVDNVEGVEGNFRPMFRDACWFKEKESLLIFFAVPVGFLICLNVLYFGVSAFLTFNNQMKSSLETQAHNLKNHLLYFRLTVIMGVTWITGVIAPLVNVTWVWYLFVVLNTFQGLFIFLAFTCSPKVKKFIQQKLINVRRPSQATLKPTFQSYCNYSSSNAKTSNKATVSTDTPVKNGLDKATDFEDKSLEKGLNKISDSTDKPLKKGLEKVTDFEDKSLEKGLNKISDSTDKPLMKGLEKVTDLEDKLLEKSLDEVTYSKDKSSVKPLV